MKMRLAWAALLAVSACNSGDPHPHPSSSADADVLSASGGDTSGAAVGVDAAVAKGDASSAGGSEDIGPAAKLPESLTLTSGDFALAIDGPKGTLSLSYAGEPAPRAVLDVHSWQIGVVDKFDPAYNYNPSNLADVPPDGLHWSQIKGLQHAEPPPQAESAPGGEWFSLVVTGTKPSPAYSLLVVPEPGIGFRLHLRPRDPDWAGDSQIQYVRVTAQAPDSEGYYGIGEMFDTPQHRGKVRALQLEANFNLDGSSNEGHVRIPLLVGTRGWGFFGETYRSGIFDVAATDKSLLQFVFNASELNFHLLAAPKPIDVTAKYWKLTGNPQLPARWAVGGLLWRDENKDQAEVLQDALDLRKYDLALSGMWIDRPYDTAVNDFGFDPKMFPDPKGMVTALNQNGLRLGVWSTPYLDPGYGGKPKAKNADMAKQNDYFVHGVGAWATVLKWGPPIDFTNVKAREFWQGLVKQYTDLGIEGFKMDYGEDIVLGLSAARLSWTFSDGSDERTMHHGYELGYHQAYASNLPKLQGPAGKTGGGWLLCRNSTWHDQTQASIIWPGDLCSGWVKHGDCTPDGECHAGGLPASVAAAISLPTAGFPLYGADTGGYRHGRAPKELFLRWLHHTAFNGVLQIGGGSNHHPWLVEPLDNKLTPGSPFDAETLNIARELIRLHIRQFPVIWSDLQATQGDDPRGLGPVRPLGLMHPELAGDAGLQAHEADEWYFGDNLLVAPVITPDNKRETWLPPGKWVRLDGTLVDKKFPDGGLLPAHDVSLTTLEVFARDGTLLPMLRPSIDTLAPAVIPGTVSFATSPGALWLQAFGRYTPVVDAKYDLYDGSKARVTGKDGLWNFEWTPGPAGTADFTDGVVLTVYLNGLAAPTGTAADKPVLAPNLNDLPKCKANCYFALNGVLVARLFGNASFSTK